MAGPSVPKPGGPARGNLPDLLTAAIFVGIGALGLVLARDLEGGALAHMGPGYLPRIVSVLLVLVGLAVGLPALRGPGDGLERAKLRPLAIIFLAIVGFGLAVTHLGFVLASVWLIVVGSLADPGGRWRQILALTIGLTAFSAIVFVFALGVQVPLWPF